MKIAGHILSSAVNMFTDMHNWLGLVVLEAVAEEHWMCLKTQHFKENSGKSSNMKLKYKQSQLIKL